MAKLVAVLKPINSTTETALQRALLRNGYSTLGSKSEIEWLDIELPVEIGNSSRRHSIDLIGKMGERYVLCELKFGNGSATDSPEYALNEILRYYESIRQNWEYLDAKELHHPDGKPFRWKDLASKSTQLIVAANAAYWAYWLGHRYSDIALLQKNGVLCYSIDVPSDYFKRQKGTLDSYTPSVDNLEWVRL